MLPWWRHLFGGGRVWALALRVNGRLAGLAQFFFWGLPRQRRLALAGSGVSDYLDILIEPEYAAAGARLVWDRVFERGGEWDEFNFQELRPGSPLLESPGVQRQPCSYCPVVELPARWEEFKASLPYGLRRSRNRLMRAGDFELVCNREELMEELFRLHEARWRARQEAGVAAAPALRAHYRQAAAEFHRRGMLRLYGLRLDGEWAAVFFGFAARGRTYAYLEGFDPRFAKVSPGSVLVGMAIEGAIAEGMREFDFLRKREGFKYGWGSRDRTNYRLAMQREAGLSPAA
jgi:CelD/BcsL family acetyltransferase involved in cellulose biosynthesis